MNLTIAHEVTWLNSNLKDDYSSPELTEDEENLSSNSSNAGVEILSGEENSEYPGYFEGPEKTMEVVFRSDKGLENGLRLLNRKQLDYLCTKAKCSILSQISNAHMDAYVLSESSLFVYRHRLIMKTCGTTTLLVNHSKFFLKFHQSEVFVYSGALDHYWSLQMSLAWNLLGWGTAGKICRIRVRSNGHIQISMMRFDSLIHISNFRSVCVGLDMSLAQLREITGSFM